MPVPYRIIAALLLLSAGLVRSDTLNTTYITLASAVYEDSLISARTLQTRIDELLAQPSAKNLQAARDAWRKARIPYQQSETFRFANPEVDDWEGALNAWPLDEGLIDYVSNDYFHEMGNLGAQLNIIANPTIKLAGQEIDAREITPQLIQSFHEFAGSEANVASGYHAIEFLLWGQDLNGTDAGAGERPYTDYASGEDCSNGHCERRRHYLKAVTQLLIQDLEDMVARWQEGGDLHNKYSAMSETDIASSIVFSIGSLSLGELAGERMKVPLEANSTEDEHDCFSDNTHWSHYYNALGMQNLFMGQYQRINGDRVGGPSLAAFARKKAPEATEQLRQAMNASVEQTSHLVKAAEHRTNPMKFDQMIAAGNRQGRTLVMNAIEALVAQTSALEALARELGLENSGAHDF